MIPIAKQKSSNG